MLVQTSPNGDLWPSEVTTGGVKGAYFKFSRRRHSQSNSIRRLGLQNNQENSAQAVPGCHGRLGGRKDEHHTEASRYLRSLPLGNILGHSATARLALRGNHWIPAHWWRCENTYIHTHVTYMSFQMP